LFSPRDFEMEGTMSDTNQSRVDRRKLLLAGVTLAASSVIAGGTASAAQAQASSLNPQPLPPSPE
jgi:hypothetical protein